MKTNDKNLAILVVAFNRPKQTARTLAAIKGANSKKLYIACDGPRKNNEDDIEKVQEVHSLIEKIGWCDTIKLNFQQSNLGCARAVSAAISWFLDDVNEGIILEDDCLPDPTFFPFCAEMLERYRDTSNVMQISGYNLLGGVYPMRSDYLFSHFGWQWGWATWKRAWEKFDLKMSTWPRFKELGFHKYFPFYSHRVDTFDRMYNDEFPSTWDYQWHYAMASNSGISVVPRVNLIQNIGFGSYATHGRSIKDGARYQVPLIPLEFPLKHTEFIYPDVTYDKLMIQAAHMLTPYQKLQSIMAKIYRSIRPRRELLK